MSMAEQLCLPLAPGTGDYPSANCLGGSLLPSKFLLKDTRKMVLVPVCFWDLSSRSVLKNPTFSSSPRGTGDLGLVWVLREKRLGKKGTVEALVGNLSNCFQGQDLGG